MDPAELNNCSQCQFQPTFLVSYYYSSFALNLPGLYSVSIFQHLALTNVNVNKCVLEPDVEWVAHLTFAVPAEVSLLCENPLT